MTEQEELKDSEFVLGLRLAQLRGVVSTLTTLYVREHRINPLHPIRLVCDYVLREFWLASDAVEAYKSQAGDPCPRCSQTTLDHVLADCNGCGAITCERSRSYCEECEFDFSGDCPDCCKAEEKGERGCRVRYWRALPFD